VSARTAAENRLRLAAFGLGLVFFFWIPFEDTHPGFVIGLGAATCSLLAAALARRWKPHTPFSPVQAGGLGLLAGLAMGPLTILLMAVKTGLHGHQVPDFTGQQVADVLSLIPVWALAGGFIGLGLWLWGRALPRTRR
jgi:hypothetical protein